MSERATRPTIIDVGREAGVAPVTVSRVFAGQGPVATGTRERVMEAARRLGYRPNQIARSLVQARTRTLGLVMSAGPSSAAVLIGAEAAAEEQDYSFIYTRPASQGAVERQRIETLLQRQVDGLLLLSSSRVSEHDHLRDLHASGIVLVSINRYGPAMGFWRLLYDYRGAARAVVRRLLAAGHRRIAFLGGSPEDPQVSRRERIEGYREALREAGLWLPAAETFGGVLPDDGDALTEALLARCPEVTAILAVADLAAAGALRALQRAGRRVPEDMAMISFDNSQAALCTNPPLSSVRPAAYEAGHKGCRLLIEQIEQPDRETGTLVLPSSLVIRRSCGLSSGPQAEEVLPLE